MQLAVGIYFRDKVSSQCGARQGIHQSIQTWMAVSERTGALSQLLATDPEAPFDAIHADPPALEQWPPDAAVSRRANRRSAHAQRETGSD